MTDHAPDGWRAGGRELPPPVPPPTLPPVPPTLPSVDRVARSLPPLLGELHDPVQAAIDRVARRSHRRALALAVPIVLLLAGIGVARFIGYRTLKADVAAGPTTTDPIVGDDRPVIQGGERAQNENEELDRAIDELHGVDPDAPPTSPPAATPSPERRLLRTAVVRRYESAADDAAFTEALVTYEPALDVLFLELPQPDSFTGDRIAAVGEWVYRAPIGGGAERWPRGAVSALPAPDSPLAAALVEEDVVPAAALPFATEPVVAPDGSTVVGVDAAAFAAADPGAAER